MGNTLLRLIFRPFNNFILQPIYRLARYLSELLFPKRKPDPELQNPIHIAFLDSSSSDQEEVEPDMTPEDRQMFEQHSNTVNGLAAKTPINPLDLDEMAYAYNHLASLLSKYGSNDYRKCLNSASNIYDAAPDKYYQDKITLLNNVALNLQARKQHAEAVRLYEEAISMAEVYLSVNDRRTLILKNNLACAFISGGQLQKGQEMLHSCGEISRLEGKEAELATLIRNNLLFHRGQGKSAEGEEGRASAVSVEGQLKRPI